jgi:hypothetical protein
VILDWVHFETFKSAREAFTARPCIYVVVGEGEELLFVGETGDLWRRYDNGTAPIVEATLANRAIYVAEAPADMRERRYIVRTLLYRYGPVNGLDPTSLGRIRLIEIEHRGEVPPPFV